MDKSLLPSRTARLYSQKRFKTIKMTDILKSYVRTNIGVDNSWYKWQINEQKLPLGISLVDGSNYDKNIELKHILSKELNKTTDEDKRIEIISYYIEDWGGIHTNKMETMYDYCTLNAEQLIMRGSHGVSSWSKANCIHNPDKYAIFDARVSATLNLLQVIEKVKKKEFYPLISSRNNTIAKANGAIRRYMKSNNDWTKKNEYEFYTQYLTLIQTVANKCNTNIATIEMLLFSKSIELANHIQEFHES
jgi:hypothetical protein